VSQPVVLDAAGLDELSKTKPSDAFRARHDGTSGQPPVSIVDTDFDLARLVGSILFAANVGTEDLVDAHVVAVCAMYQGGLIVTADPDDVHRLAQGIPAVRVITRSPA
jgi:hypothetical protein